MSHLNGQAPMWMRTIFVDDRNLGSMKYRHKCIGYKEEEVINGGKLYILHVLGRPYDPNIDTIYVRKL